MAITAQTAPVTSMPRMKQVMAMTAKTAVANRHKVEDAMLSMIRR